LLSYFVVEALGVGYFFDDRDVYPDNTLEPSAYPTILLWLQLVLAVVLGHVSMVMTMALKDIGGMGGGFCT
jgi:hypothetical protein